MHAKDGLVLCLTEYKSSPGEPDHDGHGAGRGPVPGHVDMEVQAVLISVQQGGNQPERVVKLGIGE